MDSTEQQYKERLVELETFLFDPESDDVPYTWMPEGAGGFGRWIRYY